MTISTTLNKEIKTAMVERDTQRLTLFRSVLNKAKMTAKNDGNRDYTDDDVLVALQKVIKEAQETKAILTENNADTSVPDFEINTLRPFLPAQLSDEELVAIIDTYIAEAKADQGKNVMGTVMRSLTDNYRGRYDSRLVAGLVRGRITQSS